MRENSKTRNSMEKVSFCMPVEIGMKVNFGMESAMAGACSTIKPALDWMQSSGMINPSDRP